jgi:Pyridoxamine 5'-phosphate oxidase
MTTWADVRRDQPRLAQVGEQRLLAPGVVLVGTIRRDGSPRISAVEPLLLDGAFWLCMLYRSAKARDLMRDPRLILHSIVTDRDATGGEVKIRGRAQSVVDEPAQRRYASAVVEQRGWRPTPGRFHLFTVDIDDVTYVRYDPETGDQYVARWPSGRRYVRRSDYGTSLGPPEETSAVFG